MRVEAAAAEEGELDAAEQEELARALEELDSHDQELRVKR